MIKIITNNLVAKIVCLVIASGFWIFIISQEAKIDNFPGSIPLEIKNLPENLVVVKDTDGVEIKIIADRSIWKKLSSSSFKAYLDVSGLNQGTHEIPVSVSSNVSDVQIVEINPAKIMVSLEPIISKTVPVKEKVEGDPAENMMVKNIKFDINNVDISGPQSILERISQAYAMITLNNEDTNLTKKVPLKVFNDKNEEYTNISFDPNEVEANITISKAAQTKSIGIKVNTEGKPASGYWISQINCNPSIVSISGPASNLADINYLETQRISVEGLSSSKIQLISIDLPEGVNLLDDQNDQISVEIQLSNIESSKQIIAGFNYLNLGNSLKVASIEPTNINVIFSGSQEKLGNINSDQIKVNLDLSSFNQTGTYAIDLNENMISKPEGVSVITFIPSSIRIILSNK